VAVSFEMSVMSKRMHGITSQKPVIFISNWFHLVLLWHWVLTGFKCWLLTVSIKDGGHLFGMKFHPCSLYFWRKCSLSRYSV